MSDTHQDLDIPPIRIADWTGADACTFEFLLDRLEDLVFAVKFDGGLQVEGTVRIEGKFLDLLTVHLRDPDTGFETDDKITIHLNRVDGLYIL